MGILGLGTVAAQACPQHERHARVHHGQPTYYTGSYSYTQPVNYGYYTPGYYSQPYTYYNSGWTNDWSGDYRGNFGVNTGFGFFGF